MAKPTPENETPKVELPTAPEGTATDSLPQDIAQHVEETHEEVDTTATKDDSDDEKAKAAQHKKDEKARKQAEKDAKKPHVPDREEAKDGIDAPKDEEPEAKAEPVAFVDFEPHRHILKRSEHGNEAETINWWCRAQPGFSFAENAQLGEIYVEGPTGPLMDQIAAGARPWQGFKPAVTSI